MKNKSKVARAKVLSDFLTGLAIAWFSAGIIAPFVSQSFTVNSLILGLYSLLVTLSLLILAIMFRKDIKYGD